MPRPRAEKNRMNSDTSSPATCGPISTPRISSTTTLGTRTPRAPSRAESVPPTAPAATIARNVPGTTTPTAKPLAACAASPRWGDDKAPQGAGASRDDDLDPAQLRRRNRPRHPVGDRGRPDVLAAPVHHRVLDLLEDDRGRVLRRADRDRGLHPPA